MQDDAAVAELGLSLGKQVTRTQTMRAFGPAEVTKPSTRWSNRPLNSCEEPKLKELSILEVED